MFTISDQCLQVVNHLPVKLVLPYFIVLNVFVLICVCLFSSFLYCKCTPGQQDFLIFHKHYLFILLIYPLKLNLLLWWCTTGLIIYCEFVYFSSSNLFTFSRGNYPNGSKGK